MLWDTIQVDMVQVHVLNALLENTVLLLINHLSLVLLVHILQLVQLYAQDVMMVIFVKVEKLLQHQLVKLVQMDLSVIHL